MTRTGSPISSMLAASSRLMGLLPLVAALVVWEVVGTRDSVLYPAPSAWGQGLSRMAEAGVLRRAVLETLTSFGLGLLVATVVGTALGLAVGASRTVERALHPVLEFCRTLPPPAVVPPIALLLGAGIGTDLTVITFAGIWPIVLNVVLGVKEIPSVRRDAAVDLGLSRSARALRVYLPSIAPHAGVGLRVAAPLCFIVALLSEMLGSTGGIGQLLLTRQRAYDSPSVFGLLGLVAVIGWAVNAAVGAVERRGLRRWPPDDRLA